MEYSATQPDGLHIWFSPLLGTREETDLLLWYQISHVLDDECDRSSSNHYIIDDISLPTPSSTTRTALLLGSPRSSRNHVNMLKSLSVYIIVVAWPIGKRKGMVDSLKRLEVVKGKDHSQPLTARYLQSIVVELALCTRMYIGLVDIGHRVRYLKEIGALNPPRACARVRSDAHYLRVIKISLSSRT